MKSSGSVRGAPRARAAIAIIGVAVAALLVVTQVSAAAAAPPKIVLNANQLAVKNALNRDRKAQGRTLLVSRADAQAKAQAWAARLAKDGYLHHSRLTDGIAGHACWIAENVGSSTTSIADIEARFMTSTIHRTNILDRRFNAVGVGYAKSGGNIYVVQVFIKTC